MSLYFRALSRISTQQGPSKLTTTALSAATVVPSPPADAVVAAAGTGVTGSVSARSTAVGCCREVRGSDPGRGGGVSSRAVVESGSAENTGTRDSGAVSGQVAILVSHAISSALTVSVPVSGRRPCCHRKVAAPNKIRVPRLIRPRIR